MPYIAWIRHDFADWECELSRSGKEQSLFCLCDLIFYCANFKLIVSLGCSNRWWTTGLRLKTYMHFDDCSSKCDATRGKSGGVICPPKAEKV